MKGKIKELIAISASIGANCPSCFKHHIRLAKEHGALEEEVAETIKIALLVKKNSSITIDKSIRGAIIGDKSSDDDECC